MNTQENIRNIEDSLSAIVAESQARLDCINLILKLIRAKPDYRANRADLVEELEHAIITYNLGGY